MKVTYSYTKYTKNVGVYILKKLCRFYGAQPVVIATKAV